MLPDTPPKSSYSTIKQNQNGWHVYALQAGLLALEYTVTTDGYFGPKTYAVVREFQNRNLLDTDGIAGPATQGRIIVMLDDVIHRSISALPAGLLRGFAEGEGGNLLAAVNWSVAGGVDCGVVQNRVTGPPYSMSKLTAAFSPYQALLGAAKTWNERQANFYNKPGVVNRSDRREYAGRLAVLAHNWPYGADRLANGYALSTRTADWVPASLPSWARTYAGWAQYYSMGSEEHNWPGSITRYVNAWN
jgi:hypothetical protein